MHNKSILQAYISNVLGLEIQVDLLEKKDLMDIPLYIRDSYLIYRTVLFDKSLILLEPKDQEGIKISLISANIDLVIKRKGNPVVVLLNTCSALQRRRLIEKRINFIVPGTQLFLPELLMDLSEVYKSQSRSGKGQLLRPSAQFLLIFHLLHSVSKYDLAEYNFKSVAAMTGYSPMAITLAAENLEKLGLIVIIGTKDKAMSFRYDKKELWKKVLASGLVRNPVRSRVFVDKEPTDIQLLKCNISALSEYSDLSPGNLGYYAIDNNDFRSLEKRNALENVNKDEGRFCLEVWRYSPRRIWGDLSRNHSSVDPLSLYITLQDNTDERVEMALEQLIREYQW
ncbi:MAG: hypothetical protein ABFS28_10895 [Bacteroidota bacterium]